VQAETLAPPLFGKETPQASFLSVFLSLFSESFEKYRPLEISRQFKNHVAIELSERLTTSDQATSLALLAVLIAGD
jgi:hypothetical protein